ncbi:MAG: tyrosine-type recombinase/integrase [Clostridium sp.]|nr:tyrosine-type recombinase/integrase [Clostridium sp.]
MGTNKIEEFKMYLMDLERSNNTIDAYIRSVDTYFRRYPVLTKENMLDFKKWLLAERKPKTAHNRIVALNQYCLFVNRPECCVKGIKIHQGTTVENVITLEEYEKMLSGLKRDGNERGYWLVKFLAKTGARVSEFIRLTKGGLDTGYCEMWTKGKIRRIYIPKALIDESREYFAKQESQYLFPNRYGEQMTTRGVSQNVRNWAKKYGIREEAAHPHSFRHLYAIEFLKRNSNISLLADLMGHSSVNTTSIYLKLSKEEQMRQFNEASSW